MSLGLKGLIINYANNLYHDFGLFLKDVVHDPHLE